jgi:4-hydroxy-tetrahydrodipicolinate reductase
MKLALLGYGKMGRMIEESAARAGLDVACVIDPLGGSRGELAGCDVALDFTEPSAVLENIKLAAAHKLGLVVGTTGWYDRVDEARRIVEASGIGFVYGSNFSIGVNLMFRITRYAAGLFSRFGSYDPYLEEAHHRFKKDAPSGTAIFLQREVEKEYGAPAPVTSTRAGYIPGTHTVGFDSEADTLRIVHSARSRAGFADGAILAARWIAGRTGFYEFSEIIENQLREAPAKQS